MASAPLDSKISMSRRASAHASGRYPVLNAGCPQHVWRSSNCTSHPTRRSTRTAPAAAVGAVRVLRRVGCDVQFDERQTCCGQPAFNTGYRPDACALARRLIEIFESSGADAIVSPSGSCTAMLHHYEQLLEDAGWRARARALAERTYELSSFLVNRLGVDDVGASFAGRLTWHDACHGLRDLKIREEPRRLLHHVRGAELVELPPPGAETCCGFGGRFSVTCPQILGEM